MNAWQRVGASLLLLLAGGAAQADDTVYARVTEVKAWAAKIDVYLEAVHTCGGADTHRFNMDKSDNQRYALVLTAMSGGMLASLNYTCGTDGYPAVGGVRVRAAQ